MTKSILKKYLSILNINSINQLEENDLDYWHQKRFSEIARSSKNKKLVSKQLIELNKAKDYLDEINIENLKVQFNSLKDFQEASKGDLVEYSKKDFYSYQDEDLEEKRNEYLDEDFNDNFDEFLHQNKRFNKLKEWELFTFYLLLINFFISRLFTLIFPSNYLTFSVLVLIIFGIYLGIRIRFYN